MIWLLRRNYFLSCHRARWAVTLAGLSYVTGCKLPSERWRQENIVPAWLGSQQTLWVILGTRSWFMERDVAVEFFKLNFWALCAPQAERHLVPLYWRVSRHLHRLYVPNSAAHTKTIQTDEQHHRSEFGVSCLLVMAATSDYFYHLFGHKMSKML